jgi:hypothetical protein
MTIQERHWRASALPSKMMSLKKLVEGSKHLTYNKYLEIFLKPKGLFHRRDAKIAELEIYFPFA